MSNNITNDNIQLLEYLSQQPNKVFTHKELIDKGFDLSEESYALIRNLVKREGYNHFNYTYKILPQGQGKLQELARQEINECEEKYYKEEANKQSHKSLIVSIWAIIIPSLFSLATFIISLISLLVGHS